MLYLPLITNTDDKGFTPIQKHWAPTADCYSFSNVEGSFNRHLERIRCVNHPRKIFLQNAETPIWIPDRLIRPFHQKTSIENPEEKEAENVREVIRNTKKLALSSPHNISNVFPGLLRLFAATNMVLL